MGSNPTKASIKAPPDAALDYFADAPECQQPLLQVLEYFSNYNGHAGPGDQPTFFSPWQGEEIFEMWMVAFENPHILANPLFTYNHLPPQQGWKGLEDYNWASCVYMILEDLSTSDMLLMYLAARDVRDHAQVLHVLNDVATSRKKDSLSSNPYLHFAYTYFRTCDG